MAYLIVLWAFIAGMVTGIYVTYQWHKKVHKLTFVIRDDLSSLDTFGVTVQGHAIEDSEGWTKIL